MLDTIIYTKNEDGSLNKTVTSISVIQPTEFQNELNALQVQKDNFLQGEANGSVKEVVDAIENYQNEIELLTSLIK